LRFSDLLSLSHLIFVTPCITCYLGLLAMARVTITKDNLSPLLEILIWFCLIVSLLTVLVRFVTKRYFVHKIDLDDYFILVSIVRTSSSLGD